MAKKGTKGGADKLRCDRMKVTCVGIRPVMFDRYVAQDELDRAAEEKLYLDDERRVCFPALNIFSFLGADQGSKSCAAVFMGRERASYVRGVAASIQIDPDLVPFTREGKPIVFDKFDASERDTAAGLHIEHHVARVKKGAQLIPMEKTRPVLELPWALAFTVTIYDLGTPVKPDIIRRWFHRGGIEIGFGTFRPVYGRFVTTVEML